MGLSFEEIQERLVRLDNDIADFKRELSKISWYMRGGVTLQELLHVYSYDDRVAMYAVIKENLEMTKQSHLPLI